MRPSDSPLSFSLDIGTVSFCDQGKYGVVYDCEHRDLPFFSPAGIRYLPREGERAALLFSGDTTAMIGTLSPLDANLLPGELKLCCNNGYIHLKQSGDVVINGLTITASGQLIPAKEGDL